MVVVIKQIQLLVALQWDCYKRSLVCASYAEEDYSQWHCSLKPSSAVAWLLGS